MAQEKQYRQIVLKALSKTYWRRAVEQVPQPMRERIEDLLSRWDEVTEEQARELWMRLVGWSDYLELEQNMLWMDTRPVLVLNTTLEAFISWTKQYIRTQPLHRYHWRGKAYSLGKATFIGWTDDLMISATGDFRPTEEDGAPGDHQSSKVIIKLKLHRLALSSTAPHHRIEATASCHHTAFQGLFGRLLRTIAQRWPEAADQLGLEPPQEAETNNAPTDWQSRLSKLRADARVRYLKIIEYWEAHPEKSETHVADHFRVSTKTVQRAMDFRDAKPIE